MGAMESVSRKIVYLKNGEAAPKQVAGRSNAGAQPSTAPPPQKGAVLYRDTTGAAGSGFVATMTITLNPDKTATLLNEIIFKEQHTIKVATGAWSEENGDVVVLKLDRSLDGEPLPAEMRALRLQRS